MYINNKRIYLDYASLTPVDTGVRRVMGRISRKFFANPSALYGEGVVAKRVLENARAQSAEFFNAHKDEIYFTSGGTESNNVAIRGIIDMARSNGTLYKKMHIVTSAIEHSSVLEVMKFFEKHGVDITYLGVDSRGMIIQKELEAALRPETVLVSIMMVNNEVGSFNDPRLIAQNIRHFVRHRQNRNRVSQKIYFHTDASQAGLYYDINTERLGADMITFDGQKMYGPRSSGLLFVRRGILLAPILFGGGQEKGLRPGTEDVAKAVGITEALREAIRVRRRESARLYELKKYFLSELLKINGVNLNGTFEDSSPHILNVSVQGIDNEFFILQLDARGIAASTKSACLRDENESYVIRALGRSDRAKNSIRFSFGRRTTKRDIHQAIFVIKEILALR
ncbi:MAG: hypothetical protein A2655_00905 [Candidatus Yanofskybacteria bacterium RIFCSPHIGHO2_01_FULL_43_42]|uniref:Aminotransferase class V domain-containing protein n=1 Tax=Candidatus Taylorbacteria bacterium RIFCSPLOWO2_01_FULL_45_15b TaxID=1802319 RepID=A0A1G2NDQ8_9BACT|nr:MAG: hypothetical protein A2655_00905 [Candidatus Yanofskybacteria bacterium RIFCSPHIGHO2_01_FULL_43_42]OHA34204.1 MAG: hypothetical protein A2928_04780 [Candidatus Taylorbacteria bacterium RIFCSPLOWO2_01_FULL_45_15b]